MAPTIRSWDRWEINLLKSTPIYPVAMRFRPDLITQPVLGALTQVSDIADAIVNVLLKPPYFIYTHLLVPHPPFTRNAQCKRVADDNIDLKVGAICRSRATRTICNARIAN